MSLDVVCVRGSLFHVFIYMNVAAASKPVDKYKVTVKEIKLSTKATTRRKNLLSCLLMCNKFNFHINFISIQHICHIAPLATIFSVLLLQHFQTWQGNIYNYVYVKRSMLVNHKPCRQNILLLLKLKLNHHSFPSYIVR